MAGSGKRGSLFSENLDRVAFTAYFLGAVVPLAALGFVAHRFVFPALDERLATLGMIGLFVSISVLSFASFLTLRRTTRHSLERIDRDNRRLAGLLEASRGLGAIEHGSDAATSAARAALSLADAEATFVFVRGAPAAPPMRLAAAGDDAEKLEQKLAQLLMETARLVMSEGRPASRGPTRASAALLAAPLPGEGAPAGAIIAVRRREAFDTAELDALSTLAGLAAVALHNTDLRDAQRNFFTHVTDMLVSAIDSHLGYHGGHGRRVAAYANRLGRKMGLDDRRLQRLHFAAQLHDIGMLKLDREVQMDRKKAARHTILGSRMLSHIRLWEDLAPIVHHHHEWWDGSGYPEGLSGQEIPLESRIISLCDAFDTITSPQSYREPRSFEEGVREIESGAGTQFDPSVVSAFQQLLKSGEIGPELTRE